MHRYQHCPFLAPHTTFTFITYADCKNQISILVHPLAGGIAVHLYAAFALMHDLGVARHTLAQLGEGGAMPVGGGKEADGDGYRGPYLGTVERQTGWQVKRNMPQDAKTQQESKSEQNQFNDANCNIRDDLAGTPFAV
jgi:hypothetical protein